MVDPSVQTSVAARVPARRAPRRFYVGLTLLMIALVGSGFWPYFGRVAAGHPPAVPRTIHVHAAVFSGWMVLLLAQVVLAARRRLDLHRMLGRLAVGYGALVIVMGTAAAVVAPAAHVARGEWSREQAAAFMLLPFGDMMLFATFFGAAIAYRRRPEIHKRMIVLATIALLFAPVARAADPAGLPGIYALWMAPLAVAMIYDARTRGSVHRTYFAGAVGLSAGFTRVFFTESEAWLRIGRGILDAAM